MLRGNQAERQIGDQSRPATSLSKSCSNLSLMKPIEDIHMALCCDLEPPAVLLMAPSYDCSYNPAATKATLQLFVAIAQHEA